MTGILTLNAGSSSVKFSVYDDDTFRLFGQVDALGPDARLKIKGQDTRKLGMTDHARALTEILTEVAQLLPHLEITGVGHRVTHGGVEFRAPTVLGDDVLDKLRLLVPFAPLHQPHNLACIDGAKSAFPDALQIGCFDTAFHAGHDWVHDTYGLPRRYYREGVRRFGFHGLSYEFISGVLKDDHPDLHQGRVVVAHLGNGASICGLHGGASVATTMGFSALDGLAMGTRCGQIDPGVLLYLMDQKQMSPPEITRLLYRESGLLGLSGLSHDMRGLAEAGTREAEQAIDYFCTRARREIGAMAATLGGIDALVFCGGIGENASAVRDQITEGLGFLGLGARAPVLVIPTDEECVIARSVLQMRRAPA